MCLAFFVLNSPGHPVRWLLAFNRDEYVLRPTQAAHWWQPGDGQAAVLGGRDVQAGGTWLATSGSRVAFLTNLRAADPDPEQQQLVEHKRTRGELPTGFLNSATSPLEYCQGVDGGQYHGFNLVCADLVTGELAYCHNAPAAPGQTPACPRQLDLGRVYGLSNGLLDEWLKVESGVALLTALLASHPLDSPPHKAVKPQEGATGLTESSPGEDSGGDAHATAHDNSHVAVQGRAGTGLENPEAHSSQGLDAGENDQGKTGACREAVPGLAGTSNSDLGDEPALNGSQSALVPWDALFDSLLGDKVRDERLDPRGCKAEHDASIGVETREGERGGESDGRLDAGEDGQGGFGVAVSGGVAGQEGVLELSADEHLEYVASSRFVEAVGSKFGPYGTRSQLVLVVWESGEAELRERYLQSPGVVPVPVPADPQDAPSLLNSSAMTLGVQGLGTANDEPGATLGVVPPCRSTGEGQGCLNSGGESKVVGGSWERPQVWHEVRHRFHAALDPRCNHAS